MSTCTNYSKQKTFKFEENRSILYLTNTDEILSTRIKVDGCEIQTGKRCDWLHIAKDIEMYIELKGCDVEYALKQIEESIKKLSLDSKKRKKISYIICTRSPMASSEIQTYQRQFKKLYNSDLKVKSTCYTDSY